LRIVQPAEQAAADESAIRDLSERMLRAEEAGDASFFEAVLADDIVIMPPGVPAIEGKDACLEFVRTVLDDVGREFEKRMTAVSAELEIAGEVAFERGGFSLTLTPRTGGPSVEEVGQHLRVYRRTPDGSWQVARIIWNNLGADEPRFDLRTPRCVLRPVARDDLAALHDLWTSAGVRRFLWDDEVIAAARTEGVIQQSEKMFAEQRLGLWTVRQHESSELIGFAGMWPFREPPELELLYGIAEPMWGKGLAAEAARAVVDYCAGTLALPVVRASTDAANAASLRVLDKLGFTIARRGSVGKLDTLFCELVVGPKRTE
jgi:[ribosomal protein S5]-alanine N-acetyltransferase